jgi:hypothetical protein
MPSAVVVRSVDEEDAYLGTCGCGAPWRLIAEEVAPVRSRWYDALVVGCRSCGGTRRAVFDITGFFDPPSHAWLDAIA